MSSRATPSATCLKTASLLLLAMVMAGGQRKMPQSGQSPNRLAPLMSTPPRLRRKGRGLSAL